MQMGFVGTDLYVCIVGTSHYVDGFCWFLCVCIHSPYLGPYQRLAQPDIVSGPARYLVYCQFNSQTCDAVVEIETDAVSYIAD